MKFEMDQRREGESALPYRMLKGISADENDSLQRRARNIERQLFRQRVEDPGGLFKELSFALRREGFVRVRAEWVSCLFAFQSELGRKMKGRLRGLKFLRSDDVLYGSVTRAARRCGLDPRIEDIGATRRGNQVVGSIRPVPFLEMTKALDKMLDRWASTRRDRHKANALVPGAPLARRKVARRQRQGYLWDSRTTAQP